MKDWKSKIKEIYKDYETWTMKDKIILSGLYLVELLIIKYVYNFFKGLM